MNLVVDQSVCIGAGLCVLSCAEIFDQRESDGIVTLLRAQVPDELSDSVIGAVRRCPSGAIRIEQPEAVSK